MTSQKQPFHFKEAIQEYFKLKNKYDTNIKKEVQKISRNKHFTVREKRNEFKSFRPKCIHCERPVGTLFSSKFDKEKNYRILSAYCGDTTNPCDLRIIINAGKGIESYLEIISSVEEDIKKEKNRLIQDKNNLLFGFITTEKALEDFEVLKKDISDLTNSYAFHLQELNDITNNREKKEELDKNQENAFVIIQEIKDSINKWNETGNISFVQNSVDRYVNELQPLLNTIRDSKYSSNRVEWDESVYFLFQEKVTLTDIESASVLPAVIEFHLGSGNRSNIGRTRKRRENMDLQKTKKNRKIDRESQAEGVEEEEKEEEEEEEEFY